MKTIKGIWETRKVFIDNKELFPEKSQNVCNHSPDGFMWGYNGSGPAQLALAILLEFIPDEKVVIHLYQTFKADIVANCPQKQNFEITFQYIQRWIDKHYSDK